MLGIELDGFKKVELGAVSLILIVIGYFVVTNWGFWTGSNVDTTIAQWVEDHQRPADPTMPVSKDNPYDPKKRETVFVFANHDGKLELIQYANNPDRDMAIRFRRDLRGTRLTVNYWRDEWEKMASIADPVRRIIAMNGDMSTDRRTSGTLFVALMSREQMAAELDARKALLARLTAIDDGIADGTFEHTFHEKVRAALDAYNANDKDLATNSGKKRLAARVMELGLQYVQKGEDARLVALAAYVDAVEKLLDAEQRQRLQDQANRLANNPRKSAQAG